MESQKICKIRDKNLKWVKTHMWKYKNVFLLSPTYLNKVDLVTYIIHVTFKFSAIFKHSQ